MARGGGGIDWRWYSHSDASRQDSTVGELSFRVWTLVVPGDVLRIFFYFLAYPDLLQMML